MNRSPLPFFLASCLWMLSACENYHYRKVALDLPLGKTAGLSEDEKSVEGLLKQLTENSSAAKHFQSMFHSVIVDIQDYDSLTFSVKIDDGKASYSLGTNADPKPDLVLPLYRKNLENLLQIFQDSAVSDEEAYRIHRAVFGHSLKSLFQVDALYDPKIARYLGLPDFIHMTLKNENRYEFMGTTREATVTIANVDGQWMVFPGAAGDPDVKWAVTPKQLSDFTKLVFEPGKGAGTSKEAAKQRVDEIKGFLKSVTTYTRGG